MDKNAIKKYAVWARRELIYRVSQKAYQYGIRENDIIDANADSIDGKILTNSEKKERRALIEQINEKGFEHCKKHTCVARCCLCGAYDGVYRCVGEYIRPLR